MRSLGYLFGTEQSSGSLRGQSGGQRIGKRVLFTTVVMLLAQPWPSAASPVTFVTALPVAQNQVLIRFNVQSLSETNETDSYQFPINVAYGVNSTWSFFLTANQGFASTSASTTGEATILHSSGFRDILTFVRYTLLKVDQPGSTLRLAPLAGASVPTGNTLRSGTGYLPGLLQTGTGAVAPYMGLTLGWNGHRFGMAADTTFRLNPVASVGVSPGNEWRVDGQFEVRLWPMALPDKGLPRELVLSVETNVGHIGRGALDAVAASRPSVSRVTQDVILERSTLRYQIGAGVQWPLAEEFYGSTAPLREHRAIFVFLEYYLSGPKGH